jgi:hypothetical protein
LQPSQISQAQLEAQKLLGVSEISVTALANRARVILGSERTASIFALIKKAPLSRRSMLLPCLAELVVGTQYMGLAWWGRPALDDLGEDDPTLAVPDQLLARANFDYKLMQIAAWLVDEAADQTWGIPVDHVDLNEGRLYDRVRLPESAKIGERLLVSFDSGGRVWAEVVEKTTPGSKLEEKLGFRRGVLGTKLLDTFYHPAAEIWWQWAVTQGDEPLRLPDEIPGTSSDPFGVPVGQLAVEKLTNWLRARGLDEAESGLPWANKADLWRARGRLDLPTGRTSDWLPLDRAILALLDNEPDTLIQALAELAI